MCQTRCKIWIFIEQIICLCLLYVCSPSGARCAPEASARCCGSCPDLCLFCAVTQISPRAKGATPHPLSRVCLCADNELINPYGFSPCSTETVRRSNAWICDVLYTVCCLYVVYSDQPTLIEQWRALKRLRSQFERHTIWRTLDQSRDGQTAWSSLAVICRPHVAWCIGTQ